MICRRKASRPAVPVSRKLEQDAAKKVLQEGVTGKDHGADEAKAKLPHINVPEQASNPIRPLTAAAAMRPSAVWIRTSPASR